MNRQRAAAFYFVTFCWVAFVLSNIDFAINLYLLVKGFWFSLPHGGPDVFFADLQNWQTVLREITYQLIVSASDTLMVGGLPSQSRYRYIPIHLPTRFTACTVSGAATSTSSSSPSSFSSPKPSPALWPSAVSAWANSSFSPPPSTSSSHSTPPSKSSSPSSSSSNSSTRAR